MSSKKTSWMRVLAFTVMMTLVLMTGATGLVVAEEGGFEGPPPEDKGIIQPLGEEDPSGDDGTGKMDEGMPEALPEGEGQTRAMSFYKPEKAPKLEIKLEKWVDPDEVYFKDDTVTFFFKVTNKSDRSLQDVVLVDEDLGLTIDIGDLRKEGWGSVYFTEAAVQLDPDKWDGKYYRNTASVTGKAKVGDKDIPVSDTDSAKVEWKPMIGFTKEADRENVFFKDSTVNYTFTVTNYSRLPITDLVVTDPVMGLEIDAGFIGTKHSNKSFTTTVAVNLSDDLWADNVFTNNASVSGTVQWGEETRMVSAEASDTVCYQEPLTLEKTVNKSTVNFKDEKVVYTFKVKNNLWWDLQNVKVYDETIDAILDFGKVRKGQWEDKSFEFELTNAEWDESNQFINTARVEAPFMRGETPVTLSAVDTATVTYVPPMTLEKTVEPGTVFTKDAVVKYTFIIQNNMPDKDLKNVVLTDPMLDISMDIGDIKAKSKWHNKGFFKTEIDVDLSLIEGAWDEDQLINKATATGCYEKIIWAPRGNEGDFQTMKHWSPPTECITLTAVDTATLTYDPTTLTVMKDVPNITDSAVAFDVLISWEEGLIDEEVPGDNEILQYRAMVMDTTTKSIQATISELEPYVMDAIPGVQYTVTETTKAGYTTSETSFQITLEPGEDGVITFVNTKDVVEEESTGGGSTNQGGNSGGGGDTDTNTIATVPDAEVPLAQEPLVTEMLTDVPIPLADVPQTGSNPLLNLWWMLLALSGLGILVVARKRSVNH